MKNFFMKTGIRIRSILESRYMIVIALIIGILLTLPSLKVGFVLDDYIHRSKLMGTHPIKTDDGTFFGLFNFIDGQPDNMQKMKRIGLIAWWFAEDTRVAFWRPLTEITHWIDFKFWPEKPWIMHLENVILYALVILVLALLYRRLAGTALIAGFALLLFAIDNTHGVPVTWIANRNILIVSLFGILTLLCHDAWRKNNWKPGPILGALCLMAAFCASEAAVAFCGFLFAYMLFIDVGTVRQKITSLIPYVLVGLCWLIFYKLNHFGSFQPGMYIDPVNNPLAYVQMSLIRLPLLLVNFFLEPPAEIVGMLPDKIALRVWIAELVVVSFIIMVFWPLIRKDKISRFWALSLFLSLIPLTAVIPNARLLFVPTIAGMGLLSRFMISVMNKESWLPSNRGWKIAARLFVGLFIFFHLVASPISLYFQPVLFDKFDEMFFCSTALNLPEIEDLEHKKVLVLNPPLAFSLYYLPFIRNLHGLAEPASCRALAAGSRDLKVTRADRDSIIIENNEVGKSIIELPTQIGVRTPGITGYFVNKAELEDMSIEVLESNEKEGPTKAMYNFKYSIDDPSIVFLKWQDNKFVSYTLPEIGETVIVKSN